MKFPRTLLVNDPVDLGTLVVFNFELEDAPAFKAAVIHGHDDLPLQVDLYKSQRPEYNERPVATFKRVDGVLARQP